MTRAGYDATHAGLALAISIAAIVNGWLLFRGLLRDGVLRYGTGWPTLLVRLVVANAAMALSLTWLSRPLEWWISSSLGERAQWLTVAIVAGAGSYFLVLAVLGVRPRTLRLKAD